MNFYRDSGTRFTKDKVDGVKRHTVLKTWEGRGLTRRDTSEVKSVKGDFTPRVQKCITGTVKNRRSHGPRGPRRLV